MKVKPRQALLAAGIVALGGCNMVVTDKPMFTVADGVGAPQIRSGVWRSDKPDCAVDENLPQDKWPVCAKDSQNVGDPPIWQAVNGDPLILQLAMPMPGMKSSVLFLYTAYKPLALDKKGRVIAMKTWSVNCGPPPPLPTQPDLPVISSSAPDQAPPMPAARALSDAGDPGALRPINRGMAADTPSASPDPAAAKLQADLAKLKEDTDKLLKATQRLTPTKSPWLGLSMRKDLEGACTAASAEAVRNAARQSEALADESSTSHWVRDPGPGDNPALSKDDILKALKAAKQ